MDQRTETHDGDRTAAPPAGGPLRIAVGLEGLAMGGCPINALDLARTMRARGHQVDVFAIDEDVRVSILPYAERAGFTLTLLPSTASVPARARQIRRFLDDHRSDLVHVYAPWLGPSASLAVRSTPLRAAVVTNWMMENVFYTAPHTPLILGTRHLQEEAAARHRSPVWLMEPPVDLDSDRPDPAAGQAFRRDRGIADDETAVVIVSRVDHDLKAEGMGYAIDALARLDEPRLRLVIVGDGNAFAEIRDRAERVNGLLGREAVVLTGAMVDPRPAYSAAAVMLGMGGSALRSLAHAKPLVVLGQNGFARVFEESSLDYFYDAGFFGDQPVDDPVGHLSSILRRLQDRPLRVTLGRFGLAEVHRRFGLSATAEHLELIYRSALADGPGVPTRWADAALLLTRYHRQRALRPVRRLAARLRGG